MTRLFILTASFCFLFYNESFAQYTTYESNNGIYLLPDIGLETGLVREKISSANVKMLEIHYVKQKKGKSKPNGTRKATFDEKGDVLHLVKTNVKGKTTTNILTQYNDKNHIVEQSHLNHKSDTVRHTFYTYNAAYKQTDYKAYNKKGKLLKQTTNIYKSDTQLVRTEYFTNGKPDNVWIYSYHPNGDRSESKLTNKRGKVKAIWSYACKEEGSEIKKNKDTATFCIQKSTDPNGDQTQVYLRTDIDGKIRKSVHKYNAFGKMLSYADYWGIDERPEAYRTYEYAFDTIQISDNYTSFRKGKKTMERLRIYNLKGQVTSESTTYFKRGKTHSRWEESYQFDPTGLMVRHTNSNTSKSIVYIEDVVYAKGK